MVTRIHPRSKNVYRWKERLSKLEYSVANFFLDDLIKFWVMRLKF